MNIETLTPFLALMLGWFLGEGSTALRQRRLRTEAIRLTLATLLELRKCIICNQFLFDKLTGHDAISLSTIFILRNSLPSPTQQDPSITERFNLALDEVARHNPFLASEIRGKNIINTIEMLFHPPNIQEDKFADFARETYDNLSETALPVLNNVILRTAIRAGITEWLKALYLLKIKKTITAELASSTDLFIKSFATQLKDSSANKI
jgi:hypothetical protein